MPLKSVILAAVAALALCQPAARAQYPALGVGHLWRAEIDFSRRFDAWARKRSIEIARSMKPGERLPFDAMTISRSTREGHKAFEGYMKGLRSSSARTSAALDRYGREAISGTTTYRAGPGGRGYDLPYTHSHYTITPGGYVVPGSHPAKGRVISPHR